MKISSTKSFFYSPYIISVVIAITIIIFLPDLFSKYKIDIIEKGETRNKDEVIYYNDLDNDGNSERISSFISAENLHAIQVFDSKGAIIDQWNLNGTKAGRQEAIIFADCNNDGISEIITFCDLNDSIFLYVINPEPKGRFLIKHRFISYIDRISDKLDYEIDEIHSFDINNDSVSELVLSITGNSSSFTRNIFVYNFLTDTIIQSPKTATLIYDIKFADLNNDSMTEIIGSTYACGNYPDTNAPFNDYSSWIMVYNNKLKNVFNPIEFPGFHTRVMTLPYKKGNTTYMLALFNNTGSNESNPYLYLIDDSGYIRQKKQLSDTVKRSLYLYGEKSTQERYLLLDEKGRVYQIDTNLNLNIIAEFNTDIDTKPFAIVDADNDGDIEYIFLLAGGHKAVVLRKDFSNPVIFHLHLKENRGKAISYSKIEKKNNKMLLFFQYGNEYLKYEYGYNPLYLLRYPIYLGIYIMTLLFILLIRKLQQLQIREKLELQNDIAELQLKTINNQLNPHFTFNAFNSIASLLRKEKGEKAYSYFLKFSNLVRSNLLSADQISRTIEEELSTIRNFLDIQQLRFEHRFHYEIKIDEKINLNNRIPKMILQTYIENAVNHGLKHRETGGLVNIELQKKDKTLIFIVHDNGIGRKKEAELGSESTGMGLQIMQQYFNLLNKFNAINIKQEIIDLYDNSGVAEGTKVILELPEKINFNIYHGIK